jgi:2-keto-4-pentenoate hydratase
MRFQPRDFAKSVIEAGRLTWTKSSMLKRVDNFFDQLFLTPFESLTREEHVAGALSRNNDAFTREAVAKAADLIFSAQGGAPCDPIRALLPDGDVDAAYAVQEINTKRALSAGRRLVGCKIGLTSPAVQKQLGVDQPDFGMLFADMLAAEGLPISRGRLMQPRIEAEIALILERDIAHEQPTIADLIRGTAYAVPALEIVSSRIKNWDIRITDTIADNASSGLFVLGGPARSMNGLDLGAAATMEMRRGDAAVSNGSGAACLGHPLNAAVWLAAELARRNRPLRAGDIILTGALGPMVPVNSDDRFDAHIEGLGRVSAQFAA